MIALSSMEDPVHYTNEAITRQRVALIQSIKPLPKSIVLGQYKGYQKEENVKQNSLTDTFFAMKLMINNSRLKGVPVYVRAGKMLERTITEVAVVFKLPVNRIFHDIEGGLEQNVLIYRIHPNEGIVLKILATAPGHERKIIPSYMQFCYKDLPGEPTDPYEKLLFDALSGDQTFFNDAPEIEAQWKVIDPLIKARHKPYSYKPGGWGPKEAEALIEKDGRSWLTPSAQFCRL
jgi:glucose-6-phosphate 1-dehydrogenase